MREFVAMLIEYGIVGMFDTITMMKGESNALIFEKIGRQSASKVALGVIDSSESSSSNCMSSSVESYNYDGNDNKDSDVGSEGSDDDSFIPLDDRYIGQSYIDLQENSMQQAAQLYHRFGVRAGDRVLLVCRGYPGAEISASLACLRINALFVPIDDTWLFSHSSQDHMASIIKDSSPVVAIVVGVSDSDSAVTQLAKHGVFRCVLLQKDGSLVADEANCCDVRDDLPKTSFRGLSSLSDLLMQSGDNSSNDSNISSSSGSSRKDTSDELNILYTSGSSGAPKGCIGSVCGLVNRITWQWNALPYNCTEYEDIVCRRTPFTFVDAMTEVFCPLLAGVPLWIPSIEPDKIRRSGFISIIPLAADIGVTRVTLLPSQLHQSLKIFEEQQQQKQQSSESKMTESEVSRDEFLGHTWSSLYVAVVSGEPCSPATIRLFASHFPESFLINLYGSTEVTGDVSFSVLARPKTRILPDFEDVLQYIHYDNQLEDVSCKVPIGISMTNNLVLLLNEISFDRMSAEEKSDNKDTIQSEQRNFYNSDDKLFEVVEEDNVRGEIAVVGLHVSHGYFNNPLLTNLKFRPLSGKLRDYVKKHLGISDSNSKSDSNVSGACSSSSSVPPQDLQLYLTGDIGIRMTLSDDSSSSNSSNNSRKNSTTSISSRKSSDISSNSNDSNSNGVALSSGRPSSVLYCLGRKDRQVKIRGVKVEIEDVESRICRFLNCNEVFITAMRTKSPAIANISATASSLSAQGDDQGEYIMALVLEKEVMARNNLATNFDVVRFLSARGLEHNLMPALVHIWPANSGYPRSVNGKIEKSLLLEFINFTTANNFTSSGTSNSLSRSNSGTNLLSPTTLTRAKSEPLSFMVGPSSNTTLFPEGGLVSLSRTNSSTNFPMLASGFSSTNSLFINPNAPSSVPLSPSNNNNNSNMTSSFALLSPLSKQSMSISSSGSFSTDQSPLNSIHHSSSNSSFNKHFLQQQQLPPLQIKDSNSSVIKLLSTVLASELSCVSSNNPQSVGLTKLYLNSDAVAEIFDIFQLIVEKTRTALPFLPYIDTKSIILSNPTFFEFGGNSLNCIDFLHLINSHFNKQASRGSKFANHHGHLHQWQDLGFAEVYSNGLVSLSRVIFGRLHSLPLPNLPNLNSSAVEVVNSNSYGISNPNPLANTFGVNISGSEGVGFGNPPSSFRNPVPSSPVPVSSVSALHNNDPKGGSHKRKTNPSTSSAMKIAVSSNDRVDDLLWLTKAGISSTGLASTIIDGVSCVASLNSSRPSAIVADWSVKMNKCVDASPLLVALNDGSSSGLSRVFIASHDGDVASIDTSTGSVLWTARLKCHVESSLTYSPKSNCIFVSGYLGKDVDGPSSSSTLAVATSSNNSNSRSKSSEYMGKVVALSATTGQILWEVPIEGEVKSSSVLFMDETMLCFGSYDGHFYIVDVDKTGASVKAGSKGKVGLNTGGSGRIVTKLKCNGSIFAAPCIVEDSMNLTRILIATIQGHINMLEFGTTDDSNKGRRDPSPASASKRRKSGQLDVKDSSISSSSSSSSSSGGGGGGGKGVQAISSEEGAKRNITKLTANILWSADVMAPIYGTPRYIMKESSVIVTLVNGSIMCLSSHDGLTKWEQVGSRPIFSTAFISEVIKSGYEIPDASNSSRILSSSSSHVVTVGSHSGLVRCLSSLDGSSLFECDLGAALYSSPFVSGRFIVAATTAGGVHAIPLPTALFVGNNYDTNAVSVVASASGGSHTASLGPPPSDSDSSTRVVSARLPAEIYSSPVVDGNCIYVGCRDDKLYRMLIIDI